MVSIDSRNRHNNEYPTATHFRHHFDNQIFNCKSLKLISCCIEKIPELEKEPYLFISIDEVHGQFEKNNCAGSIFHGINIIVDCIDDELQTFYLLTLRSFGESLYHHITDASLEFGYVGV